MRTFKRLSTLLTIALFSLIVLDCEKIEPEMNIVNDSETEVNSSHLKSVQLNSTDEINYLLDLIIIIENMVDEGSLSKGHGNALIAKIENVIRIISMENPANVSGKKAAAAYAIPNDNASTNAASGELKAFINQIDALISAGKIPVDEGQLLIDKAENAIIVTEGSFIDPRDGQEYSVVLIGDQLWMAENLRAIEYPDGIPIPYIESYTDWATLEGDEGAYCWFNNNSANQSEFGGLYTWAAAMNGASSSDAIPSGVQGVCPDGWHLPSNAEWMTLEMELGMSYTDSYYGYGVRGTNEGSKLAGDADLWNDGPLVGDPLFGSSEFSALPGGGRFDHNDVFGDGYFTNFGTTGFWWSSTEEYTGVFNRQVDSWSSGVSRNVFAKGFGFSVRCVKDFP
jgi:uncharacterized protein (TIGR02145 family)